MKTFVIFAMALLLLPGSARAANGAAQIAGDITQAVNAFYAVYKDQHVEGGIPDATGRLRYAPVLSPRLNKQLADAAAAQARLTAKIKNAVPPMLEGDIFSSLFEGATSWKLEGCDSNGSSASCVMALSYTPLPAPNAKSSKPANWRDRVVLALTPQGWKVDDVIYDAGFQFGNTGRLSDMLQMVVAANPK